MYLSSLRYNRGMHLNPYEKENLIFIDTEFSDLDPYKGELLSVGIVTQAGKELYIELKDIAESSDWVKKHVLPQLNGPKFTKKQCIEQIRNFLGKTEPFAIAFVDNYDVIYLTKLFGAGKLPFKWLTIDFASILFSQGINPVRFKRDASDAKQFYASLGIDLKLYRPHHALDDARLLRDVWLKITTPKK